MRKSNEIFNELCEVRFQLANADVIYDLTGGSCCYTQADVDALEREYKEALANEES